MKQLIILVASIMLGIFLFNLIAGSGNDSIYSSVGNYWQTVLEVRQRK